MLKKTNALPLKLSHLDHTIVYSILCFSLRTWWGRKHINECAQARGGQRSTSCVFPCSSLVWLGWLASKPKGSCLSPQYWDLRQAPPRCSVLTGSWGPNLGSSCLHGKYLLTESHPQPNMYKIGNYFQIKSLSCFSAFCVVPDSFLIKTLALASGLGSCSPQWRLYTRSLLSRECWAGFDNCCFLLWLPLGDIPLVLALLFKVNQV